MSEKNYTRIRVKLSTHARFAEIAARDNEKHDKLLSKMINKYEGNKGNKKR